MKNTRINRIGRNVARMAARKTVKKEPAVWPPYLEIDPDTDEFVVVCELDMPKDEQMDTSISHFDNAKNWVDNTAAAILNVFIGAIRANDIRHTFKKFGVRECAYEYVDLSNSMIDPEGPPLKTLLSKAGIRMSMEAMLKISDMFQEAWQTEDEEIDEDDDNY